MENPYELIQSDCPLLPNIKEDEYFQYDEYKSFSSQRQNIVQLGASEVGGLFIGSTALRDLIVSRILRVFDRTKPFPMNLAMKKGKANEQLGFMEFSELFYDKVKAIYPNKYANGTDKYSYMKQYKNFKVPICSTIDGYCVTNTGEIELIEIKYSDKDYLEPAIYTYIKDNNFLESRYFFKYYIQCQIQLACTDLKVCNLVLLVGNETKNCRIIRDDKLLDKVYSYMYEFVLAINEIVGLIKLEKDDDFFKHYPIEEVEEYLKSFVMKTDFYKTYRSLDYISEFIEYTSIYNSDLRFIIDSVENGAEIFEKSIEKIEEAQDKIRKIKHVIEKNILEHNEVIKYHVDYILEHYNLSTKCFYKYDDKIFRLNLDKKDISNRYKSFKLK